MDENELRKKIAELYDYVDQCTQMIAGDDECIARINGALQEVEQLKQQFLDKVGAMIDPSEYSYGISSQDYNQNGRKWAGTTYYRFQQQVDGAYSDVYMQDSDTDGTMLTDYYSQYVSQLDQLIASLKSRIRDYENEKEGQDADRSEYQRRIIKAEDLLYE